jgi:hypothetical protein
MRDLRNVSSAYAMPGISSNAMVCEYGQVEAGPSSSGGGFLAATGGSRLSLDISEGSEVKSVLGVPMLALVPGLAEREREVGAEEASVSGDGGVVALLRAAPMTSRVLPLVERDRFAWVITSVMWWGRW